jgi:hypothetical protein
LPTIATEGDVEAGEEEEMSDALTAVRNELTTWYASLVGAMAGIVSDPPAPLSGEPFVVEWKVPALLTQRRAYILRGFHNAEGVEAPYTGALPKV